MTHTLICPHCWRIGGRTVVGVDVDPPPEGSTRVVACPECSTTLLYASDDGALDIGIIPSDHPTATNEIKLFHEEFVGFAHLDVARRPIRVMSPPSLDDVLKGIREALVALVEPDPMCDDTDSGACCHWCFAPMGAYPAWNEQRKPVQHESGCAWVRAHGVLGRRLPGGHEGTGSTCVSD